MNEILAEKRLQVFFSYTREDKERVQEIYAHVAKRFEPWMDVHNLGPGRWDEAIQSEIRQCDIALVFLSKSAADTTRYFQMEMHYIVAAARERVQEIIVLPVLLDPVPIPYILREWEWMVIDIANDGTAGLISKLVQWANNRGVPIQSIENPETRKKALQWICAQSFTELCKKIRRLFEQGYGYEYVSEPSPGSGPITFLLRSSHCIDAAVIKAESYPTFEEIQQKILPDVRSILELDHSLANNEKRRTGKVYWVTRGEIAGTAATEVHKEFGSRLELWDGKTLVDKFVDKAPRLVPQLDLLDLETRAADNGEKKLWVAASRLYVELFKRHDMDKAEEPARDALESAKRCLSQQPLPHRFFSNILRVRIECYQKMADDSRVLSKDSMEHFHDLKRLPEGLQKFWTDLTYIEQQVELLVKDHITPTIPLTWIRTAVLALRMGYSPLSPEIERAIEQLEFQFHKEQDRAIDRTCSLCTGAAVSLLGLANLRKPEAVGWLSGLGPFRYRHLDPSSMESSSPSEHAMHYTASVLNGFSDLPEDDSTRVEAVLNAFFCDAGDKPIQDADIVRHWMTHRKETQADIFAQVLPGVLRYWMRHDWSVPEFENPLKVVITELVTELWEATSEMDKRGTYFQVRENIPGLILACRFTKGDAAQKARDLLRSVIHVLQSRARSGLKEESLNAQIFSSRIDLAVAILDGWLLYWETLLSQPDFYEKYLAPSGP